MKCIICHSNKKYCITGMCRTCYNKRYYQQYRQKYPEKHRLANKQCYNKNREKRFDYKTRRLATDLQFKLASYLRTRLSHELKKCKANKSISALKLIGCSLKQLKKHLEKQFQQGMSWDNHGRGWNGKKEWHVDHKKACFNYDLNDPEQLKECFHYTNLQPLWSEDNLSKGNKV